MRINNADHINSYSSISKDNETKKLSGSETCKYSTDRVEVASKPSIDQIEVKIKDNILKTQNQKTSAEKLEAIKDRISRNEYSVNTDDIIKSIL
ncbi:MAG: hypothetical protein PHV07_04575 [Oscillospiraceae bacterium]|nr:hypothetical protein [Oscillospiraceae bacterium]